MVSKKTLELPHFFVYFFYLTMFRNLLRRSLLGKTRAATSSQCVCPERIVCFAQCVLPGSLPSDSAVRSDHDQTKWCACSIIFMHFCTWNKLEPLLVASISFRIDLLTKTKQNVSKLSKKNIVRFFFSAGALDL